MTEFFSFLIMRMTDKHLTKLSQNLLEILNDEINYYVMIEVSDHNIIEIIFLLL